MAKAIPKWVQERYSILWKKFKDKEITYENIEKTLSIDDKNTISVFINELKKAGWIDVQLDKQDSRKRVYSLLSPNEAMGEIESVIERHKDRISR